MTVMTVWRLAGHVNEIPPGELMVFWSTVALVIVTLALTFVSLWVGLVEIRKMRTEAQRVDLLSQAENNRHAEQVVQDVADIATVKIQNKP